MKLLLRRLQCSADAAIGELLIDGVRECYTLEDEVRPPGVKVPGKTAIPAGTYHVIITMSQRFKRPLPLLVAVPMFSGVRIHAGNTAADTEGCILVGRSRGEAGQILESRLALISVYAKIANAIRRGEEVTIEVA